MFGHIDLSWQFLTSLMSIVFIDLMLAGDNAVVIAMAVNSLPEHSRRWGIVLGAAGAVVVRVTSTFLIAKLLSLQFVKLAGGTLILWLAVKLLIEDSEPDDERKAGSLWKAFWIIIVADMSMGTDNMLAVAGASHGNFFLLLFGLGLSIPFIVFTSSLLTKLMDRYRILLYIGAGILGKVGGEMIITDPFVQGLLEPDMFGEYVTMIFFTLLVLATGRMKVLSKRKRSAESAKALELTSSAVQFDENYDQMK
jgi:YjbE family integral membrane protein